MNYLFGVNDIFMIIGQTDDAVAFMLFSDILVG